MREIDFKIIKWDYNINFYKTMKTRFLQLGPRACVCQPRWRRGAVQTGHAALRGGGGHAPGGEQHSTAQPPTAQSP